jgi:ariadne-1
MSCIDCCDRDLEAAVEQLSQLLQDEIKAETIKEHRKNTINKTVYVRQRHDLILSDTAKRLQDGTCTWNISIE